MARRNATHAQPVFTCEPPTCPENPTSHSLRQFFTAYRSATTQNHWTVNQSLTYLPNYLPVALRELIHLADAADVDSVGGCEDVLLQSLFPGDNADQSQRDLFLTHQKANESVLSYFGRVMQIGRTAFADLDGDQRNRILANYFVSTLKSDLISSLAHKQPESPEQALTMARQAEATASLRRPAASSTSQFCRVHGQGAHSSDRCFSLHPHLRPRPDQDQQGRSPRPPPATGRPARRDRLNQLDYSASGNDNPSNDVPLLDWDQPRHE